MRISFSLLITLHAIIHIMGFAKAFGLASLEQLRVPISRPMGLLWLVAAVLLITAGAALFTAHRWFWLVGALALVASQTAIIASWSDARFGTIANAALLASVIYGAFAWGPFGLRAEYERLVRDGLAQAATNTRPQDITEADLAVLPPPVQRYLRFAGVVGTPRVQGFRARLTGRIRSSAKAPWMPFMAEQHNFFAPGSLLDPSIRWREIDTLSVEATYTNGPHTIRAVLVFDDSGALVNFRSDDCPALAEDGKTMLPQSWSTPIRDYRTFGPYRLGTRGEGRAGRSASLSLKTVRSGCDEQCASCARRRSDGARSPGAPASPRPCGSARMSARESRAEAQRRGEETDGPRQLDPRRAARCLLWLTSVGSALNIRSTVSSTVTPQQ